ncbi:MAG TPA: DUF3570 domain-containing protein [Polyangiales bacterium]|nr:DUF3570 domain-containing protein [Polyangiales bacterium]
MALLGLALLASGARAQSVETRGEIGVYADSDYVTVVTPRVGFTLRDSQWNAGASYLLDAVSAASVDIVATASRRWSELRHEVSAAGGYTPGDLELRGSATASIEPDYVAWTGVVQGSLRLADDHVTLALGYVLGHDTAGRTGTSFEVFAHRLWKHGPMLAGSFVIDRVSLFYASLEASLDSGDQAKPYRYVPMFERRAAQALPNGASIEQVNALRRAEAPLERLPLARGRYALTARYLRRAGRATLRAEERLYADSWRLFASTSDVRYAIGVSRVLELAPTLRVHVQSGASFWERAYVAPGGELPELRTADRELGPLWTATLGADLRYALDASDEATSPALLLRIAAMRTAYLDALYLDERYALFASLSFAGAF